jgi:hypothetical protein
VNNKYLKYCLIAGAVAVWAMIIYRIVRGIRPVADPVTPRSITINNELTTTVDSFSLNADYPDPFQPDTDTTEEALPQKGGPALSGTSAVTGPGARTQDPTMTREAIAGMIQLNGIISNPKKKSKIAILTIRGKEYVVREKEKIGEIRLGKIGKDQIQVFYRGESYTIVK